MKYHLSAFITITIWSLTYISTKVLLGVLSPLEISLYRFLIGYICLVIMKPPRTFKINIKEDLNIILSGLFGIFLYYLVENTATKLTQASHVAIIVSTIPIITSILAHYINRDEKFKLTQIITFILAFSGIAMIIFEGSSMDSGLPLGNILALIAAIIFSFYNIFLRRISPGLHPLTKARKINFYGLLFIIILFIFTPEKTDIRVLFQMKYVINILFLVFSASGLCILLWGYSITGLGAVKTSNYIYLAPLITGVASYFMLNEDFTLFKILGMLLILLGMSVPYFITIDRKLVANAIT